MFEFDIRKGGTPPVMVDPTEADRLAAWQQQRLRIGFANGCFDILHAGHVKMLEEARAHCDRLIVAVDTDASVAALKGPERPINPLSDRIAVLAALRAVDMVLPFGPGALLPLIEALRPDFIFKGDDYTPERVVGFAQAATWGGKVVILDRLTGRSTTSIVARAREPRS